MDKAELRERVYWIEDGNREAKFYFTWGFQTGWSFDHCDFDLEGRKVKYGYGDWKFLAVLAKEIQRVQEELKGDKNGPV
jgi:hypothetical protein